MTATAWQSVALNWAEHADYIDARTARLTERMLELTHPGPDDRVLELACGCGGLGLAAAEHAGEVVVSDVAPAMVEIAAARARERGLGNVEALTLDFEQLDQPTGSYDVVLCREGLMFAADPARTAAEIARVLRPGGRVAVAVWGPRERNPWLGVVFDAVGAQLGLPVPPPGVPGPFSLGDAGRLRAALAPLARVTIEQFDVPLQATSLDEWWTRTTALSDMLARLAETPAAGAIRERAFAGARSFLTSDGLEIPGMTLVASGRKA